jgi:hypothetical protein
MLLNLFLMSIKTLVFETERNRTGFRSGMEWSYTVTGEKFLNKQRSVRRIIVATEKPICSVQFFTMFSLHIFP